MEDLTGRQFGPYRITAPLGEGGMAAVYRAYQPSVDRYVALKVLPQSFATDPQFAQRFEREAKVLAKLQHPNILPIHDYGQADGYPYIVMPVVEGGELSDLMHGDKLPLAEVVRIISQVGDALDYAHTEGVVHRDIKPSNILLDQRGNCLLTDFGLAKIVSNVANKLTSSGFVVGTPSYIAPEQGMGDPADGRSDIYALGVVLYELMTGQVPFQAETPIAVVMKHIHDPLLSPREFRADIPEAIEQVILKALAKDPQDRYSTAGEMVKAIQAAVDKGDALPASSPIQQTDIRQVKPPPSSSSKANPASPSTASGSIMWWSGAGLIAVVLLALLGFGSWLFLDRQQPEAAAPPAAPPTEAVQPPTETPPQEELPPAQSPSQPTATPTQVVLPTSTSQPALPEESDEPVSPPPGRDLPPLEALQACQGQSSGSSCQFVSPRGDNIEGACQQLRNRLFCLPNDRPVPQR